MMPRGQRAGPEGVWVMRWPWVRNSGGGRVHLLTADNKRKRMDRGEEEEREQIEKRRDERWMETDRERVCWASL